MIYILQSNLQIFNEYKDIVTLETLEILLKFKEKYFTSEFLFEII